MEAAREVADAGVYVSDHIGKVLPGGGPGGDTLWGRNLGTVGSYD